MKLKYYLRGLGTGMAVTALIIGISGSAAGRKTMTDEEVLARAKELGMVERTVLSELETTEKESQTEQNPSESVSNEESSIAEDGSAELEEESDLEGTKEEELKAETEIEAGTETEPEAEAALKNEPEVAAETEAEIEAEPETETKTEEVAQNDADFGMPDEVGTISIQIVSGDSSDSVSRRLAEAGLVDNAVNYDRYLCQNGYDKKIQTGNYEIPANATEEEIARMITNR